MSSYWVSSNKVINRIIYLLNCASMTVIICSFPHKHSGISFVEPYQFINLSSYFITIERSSYSCSICNLTYKMWRIILWSYVILIQYEGICVISNTCQHSIVKFDMTLDLHMRTFLNITNIHFTSSYVIQNHLDVLFMPSGHIWATFQLKDTQHILYNLCMI